MANTTIIQNNLSSTTPQSTQSGAAGLLPPTYTPNMYKPQVDPMNIAHMQSVLREYQSLAFPQDTPKYYTNINVYHYSRTSMQTVGRNTPIQSIRLPLPLQMADFHKVEYGGGSVTMATGAGINALTGGRINPSSRSNASDGMPDKTRNSWLGKFLNDVKTGAGKVGGAVGVAAFETAKAGIAASELTPLASDLDVVARGFIGYSPNQYKIILLDGPDYKRFTMSWRLVPRSETESEVIRLIIRFMNNYMSPGMDLAGGLWFTFPHIFDVGFFPSAKYLYKFKPAVLENFQMNYAPDGPPRFYRQSNEMNDNPPEAVEISLTFLEMEYWLFGDFNNDPNPYNRNVIPGEERGTTGNNKWGNW